MKKQAKSPTVTYELRPAQPLTARQRREIQKLGAMLEDKVDTSDIPELPPGVWRNAVRGKSRSAVFMVLIVAVGLLSPIKAQKTDQPYTSSHSLSGTVNVLLANKQGLVAITDSLLTDPSGTQRHYGQKLFQLDPNTIATIAG